jgi:hypothetical protein
LPLESGLISAEVILNEVKASRGAENLLFRQKLGEGRGIFFSPFFHLVIILDPINEK